MNRFCKLIFGCVLAGTLAGCQEESMDLSTVGPLGPSLFLPQDTFVYDCEAQLDTFSVPGRRFIVTTMYDAEDTVLCIDEPDCRNKWLEVRLRPDEVVLCLEQNEGTTERTMKINLSDLCEDYQNVWVIQLPDRGD